MANLLKKAIIGAALLGSVFLGGCASTGATEDPMRYSFDEAKGSSTLIIPAQERGEETRQLSAIYPYGRDANQANAKPVKLFETLPEEITLAERSNGTNLTEEEQLVDYQEIATDYMDEIFQETAEVLGRGEGNTLRHLKVCGYSGSDERRTCTSIYADRFSEDGPRGLTKVCEPTFANSNDRIYAIYDCDDKSFDFNVYQGEGQVNLFSLLNIDQRTEVGQRIRGLLEDSKGLRSNHLSTK
jgi:hypothetical protein